MTIILIDWEDRTVDVYGSNKEVSTAIKRHMHVFKNTGYDYGDGEQEPGNLRLYTSDTGVEVPWDREKVYNEYLKENNK